MDWYREALVTYNQSVSTGFSHFFFNKSLVILSHRMTSTTPGRNPGIAGAQYVALVPGAPLLTCTMTQTTQSCSCYLTAGSSQWVPAPRLDPNHAIIYCLLLAPTCRHTQSDWINTQNSAFNFVYMTLNFWISTVITKCWIWGIASICNDLSLTALY